MNKTNYIAEWLKESGLEHVEATKPINHLAQQKENIKKKHPQ